MTCQKILKSHPIFSPLSTKILAELASLCTEQRYAAGGVVVKENDLVDSIYFIAEGAVEITQLKEGKEIPLAVLHQQESIGLSETGFYSTTGKRTATVTALSDSILFRLDLNKFQDFLNKHSEANLILQENAKQILKMNFIKQVLPFEELSVDRLYWLAKQVTELSIKAGTLLFNQGDEASECYLLHSGQVDIFLKNPDGSSQSLAIIKPPSIFGETAILTQAPRNASARALEDCKLLMVSRSVLEEVVKHEADTSESLLAIMSLRNRPLHHEYIEQHVKRAADGQESIVLKNPRRGKFYSLNQEGYFIWQKLDGKHSVRDIALALFAERHIFDPKLVSNLILELEKMGFVAASKKDLYVEEKKIPTWIKFAVAFRHIMEAKTAFYNVDSWITKTYQLGIKFFYTIIGQLFLGIIAIIGFVSFIYLFPQSEELMKATQGAAWLLLATIPLAMVIMVLHEVAHAYTTKAFGRTVQSFGIGWFWIGPIAFCDTSDMWLSPRWQRIGVDIAGVYLQVFAAGLASLIALFISQPFIFLVLWYFALFNYLTVFSNLNVIIELDGYYILMDVLDVPNLKLNAIKWLVEEFPKTWTQPKLWLTHKPEIIYWAACFIYLCLSFFIPYVVLIYLLAGLFGITHPLFSFVISLFILIASVMGIVGELRQS